MTYSDSAISGLVAAFARRRERELGGQLAGHLAVDGVERRPGRDRVAVGQLRQTRQPRRAPLPRVVGEHLGERVRQDVLPARLDRGARATQPHLDRVLGCLVERAEPLRGVAHVDAGQPARRRVAGVDLERGQLVPRERVAGLVRRRCLEQHRRRRVEGRAAGPAVGGDHLAEHAEHLGAQLVDAWRTGPPGRPRTPWPAGGRTSRTSGTPGCRPPAAATSRTCVVFPRKSSTSVARVRPIV